MMTVSPTPRVDFYIFENSHPNSTVNMACKIVEKAFAQLESVYIFTPNKALSETIDKALWTFQDTSFIPHQIQSTENSEDASLITIGHDITTLSALKNKNILLNLTPEIDLSTFQSFKRIIELVNEQSESNDKEKARQKYKTYRENKFMLHSHHVKS